VDAAREAAGAPRAALPPVNFLPSGEPLVPQSGHEGITWVGAGQWRVYDTGAQCPTASAARVARSRAQGRAARPRRSITQQHSYAMKAAIKGYNAWADAKRAELAALEPWLSMPPSAWRASMRERLRELWALERPREGGAGEAGKAGRGGRGQVARTKWRA
jgi:hypothetical protein